MIAGSFSFSTCFFTITSKAMSGVNRPLLIPCVFLIAYVISLLSSFSSKSTLTSSKGNLSVKIRLIFAPPDSSLVLTSAESAPDIAFSQSLETSCRILEISANSNEMKIQNFSQSKQEISAYVSRALVFLAGSSGLKFLYSATSFSMLISCAWSLFLSAGSVSLM